VIWYRTSAPSPNTQLAWTFQRQYILPPLPIAVGYRWLGGFSGIVPKTRRYQVILALPPATNSAITDSQIISSFVEFDAIEFGVMRPFLPPSGVIGPYLPPPSPPIPNYTLPTFPVISDSPQVLAPGVSQTIPLGYNSSYTLTSGIFTNQSVTIVDNLGRAANGTLTIIGSFNTGDQVLITEPYGSVSASWNGTQWVVTSLPITSPPTPPSTINYISVTQDTTLTVSQSNTVFDNYGATQAVNLTLPAWQLGLVYTFTVAVPYLLNIIPNGSDQLSANGQLVTSLGSSQLYASLSLSTSNLAGVWIARSLEGGWGS
jgi:hypothetical protein